MSDEKMPLPIMTCPSCGYDMVPKGVVNSGFMKDVWECHTCGTECVVEHGTGKLWQSLKTKAYVYESDVVHEGLKYSGLTRRDMLNAIADEIIMTRRAKEFIIAGLELIYDGDWEMDDVSRSSVQKMMNIAGDAMEEVEERE